MKKKDLYYERIPTKLLREDVRYLGNILGKVIKSQESEKFFILVEKIRKLSKANKKNPNEKKLNNKVLKAIKRAQIVKSKYKYIQKIERYDLLELYLSIFFLSNCNFRSYFNY